MSLARDIADMASVGRAEPGPPASGEGRKGGLGSRVCRAALQPRCASVPPPGTTAHVGIMLYGAEGRSGHRHLDGDRAFRRNSLDVFQIATPHSLGSVRKIRVWHDNKGLWGHPRPAHQHPRCARRPDAPPPHQASAPPGSCSTSLSGTCRTPAAPSSWSMTGCRWRLRPTAAS